MWGKINKELYPSLCITLRAYVTLYVTPAVQVGTNECEPPWYLTTGGIVVVSGFVTLSIGREV
jgi:hypothetical protein